MSRARIEFVQEPDRVRIGLSPVRRKLLDRLREPASATQLAAELKMSRQRVGYHLRALEGAGLIEVVEERQRRGFVERILGVSASGFVVDPSVMGGRATTAVGDQDRYVADHLVEAAARVVRDVGRMQSKAEGEGTRLVTFTIETEVHLAGPADVGHFTAALAQLVAGAVSEFDAPSIGHKYRVIVGGHPEPKEVRTDEP